MTLAPIPMAVAWCGPPESQSPGEPVARFVSAVAPHFWRGIAVSVVEANGQGCALISRDGGVAALITVGASVAGIDRIMWMLKPSKLKGVSPPVT